MGAIIGRFRKKKTTLEKLEELDKDIKCIEKYRYHTQQAEKKIVGQFIVISTLIYILAAITYYYYFSPKAYSEQIVYITPLLLVPFIIWFIKRILTWYYKKKINKNELKITQLIQEKKRLIEQVMETETYKVAKNILEKYSPESTINVSTPPQFKISSAIRQRPNVRDLTNKQIALRTSPIKTFGPIPSLSATPMAPNSTNGQGPTSTEIISRPKMPMLPMPRVVLPKERTLLDKMVEYLVGDGPNNRYALICKDCHAHNGMALREEFEYLPFRCCYCATFNPSRKLRPSAPKLEDETIKRRFSIDKSSSDSEKISDQSDSDYDKDVQLDPKDKTVQEFIDSEKDIVPDEKSLIDPTICTEKDSETTIDKETDENDLEDADKDSVKDKQV